MSAEEDLVPGGMSAQALAEANKLAERIHRIVRPPGSEAVWVDCGNLNGHDMRVSVRGRPGTASSRAEVQIEHNGFHRWHEASAVQRICAGRYLPELERLVRGCPLPDSLEDRLADLGRRVELVVNTGIARLEAWGAEASVRLPRSVVGGPEYCLAYCPVDGTAGLSLNITRSQGSVGVIELSRCTDWNRRQQVDAAKAMPDLLAAARQAVEALLQESPEVDAAAAVVLGTQTKDKQ